MLKVGWGVFVDAENANFSFIVSVTRPLRGAPRLLDDSFSYHRDNLLGNTTSRLSFMIKIQLPHYLFHSVLSPRHQNIYLRNGDAVLQPQLRQYRYFTTIQNLHGRFFLFFLRNKASASC